MDPQEIMAANESFAPQPDLAFLLDLPVSTALQRITLGRAGQKSAFEKEAYLNQVRQLFLELQRPWFHLIDAQRPQPELQQAVLSVVREEIPELFVEA
jgi:thymidylate kinase